MTSSLRPLHCLGAALLALSGCSDPPPSAPSGPIRLADLLDQARIESPLTEIPAAQKLQDLPDETKHTVHFEDFEQFDPATEGWPVNVRGVVDETETGRAFLSRGFRPMERRTWLIQVEPNSHYIFERDIKTDAPLPTDFAVIEQQTLSSGRGRPADREVNRGVTLMIHRPTAPEPDGSWQHGSVSFFTKPETRAVEISLQPTSLLEQEQYRWWVPPSIGHNEVWFDNIRLVRVAPSPRDAIALLKAQSPASALDAELGIHKRGQFPPRATPLAERAPQHENFSRRFALYAPPPTDLGFPVHIGEGAVLRFSVCLARETQPGHAAQFDVIARVHGEEETLWSATLAALPDQWWWHDHTVDLSDLGGESIELLLRTRAIEGTPHPIWGNPTVDVPPDGDGPETIILLAVDTLRADRLSCYGYTKNTTPHIDALAADGVRFDQVASNATWTCPSFASIFTGVVPARHGVWFPGPIARVPDHFETLAERFRAAGWATQSIAFKYPIYDGGYDQGFDVAFNVPREHFRAEDNLAEAMEWLEGNRGRRSFLFLHFDDPHQPFNQPEPFDRKFGDHPSEHGIAMPPSMRDERAHSEEFRAVARGLYDGEVAYVDDRIGAFLAALKERGLYDDAAILFLSDHGEQMWEHGEFGHGSDRLYDEVVRVPLIVKPPEGDFARGTVVPSQIRGFDAMPTLLDLAGLETDDDLDAQTLMPFLHPDALPASDRDAVIDASKHRALAARTPKWKYILRYGVKEVGSTEELFDLDSDPGETRNVADRHPEQVQRMRLQVLEYCLVHRPGRYLVVTGAPSESPQQHDYVVRGIALASSFIGLLPKWTGEAVRFAGASGQSLVLLADLDVVDQVTVEPQGENEIPVLDMGRYPAGTLEQLVESGKPGVFLFEGRPSEGGAQTDAQSIDMQQIEALRALGYVK